MKAEESMKKNLHVVTAPEKETESRKIKIFLAGTIDNADSVDWQRQLIEEMSKDDLLCENVTVFNPRREFWNPNATDDELREQIEWELNHLEKADIIVMNILGSSKSPISLLELGLHMRTKKLSVYCPETFYRFMNVETTCLMYGVPLIKSNEISDIIYDLKKLMK